MKFEKILIKIYKEYLIKLIMDNKKMIFMISLIILSLGVFVSAVMINQPNGNYNVEIELTEGWNIIAGTMPEEGILEDSEIKLKDIGAMYYYSPLIKK